MTTDIDALLKGKIIDVWTAHETVDDRGSIGGIVGVAKTQNHAEKLAEGKGWYGGKGAVAKKSALLIDGEHVLILASTVPIPLDTDLPGLRKQQIADALAKLSPAEQTLLGLDKGVR